MSCFAFKRAALKVTYIASFLSMLEGPDLCPNRRGHRSKSSGKPLRRAADQSCRPHHPVLKWGVVLKRVRKTTRMSTPAPVLHHCTDLAFISTLHHITYHNAIFWVVLTQLCSCSPASRRGSLSPEQRNNRPSTRADSAHATLSKDIRGLYKPWRGQHVSSRKDQITFMGGGYVFLSCTTCDCSTKEWWARNTCLAILFWVPHQIIAKHILWRLEF